MLRDRIESQPPLYASRAVRALVWVLCDQPIARWLRNVHDRASRAMIERALGELDRSLTVRSLLGLDRSDGNSATRRISYLDTPDCFPQPPEALHPGSADAVPAEAQAGELRAKSPAQEGWTA